MARFRYRMQNILELKQKLEEQSKMNYANQRRELTKAEEKEQELRDIKAAYEEEQRKTRMDLLDLREIRASDANIEVMEYKIKCQREVVEQEKRKLEMRRRELTKVMQERKAQEKLRERAFEQFKKDESAAESKTIDELTSYTYGNKSKKG
ncbi:MAG: flagellar FliJ family protein [Lachnospiraceae bacterium]|nr:flagellar FliJ family protein [Lachnospiraceae bacterium]